MKHLFAPLTDFWRSERGTVMTEGLIVMPMLTWAYLSLFVFWDAYRSMNVIQKASYTVSDIISREADVTAADLTGLSRTLEFLMGGNDDAAMRVTSVVWDLVDNRYEVLWSRNVAGTALPALTTATLQSLATRLPTMTDGDTVILLETSVPYTAALSVGLDGLTFDEFIVTRPRFVNRVEFVS